MLRSIREGGFTLIEMMITLAVLGVIVALGLPGIMQWMQNSQIRVAADSIQAGMTTARIEAIRRNTAVSVVLTNHGVSGGTGWEVRLASDNSIIQSVPDAEGSRNVVLTPFPDGTWTTTFSGFGRIAAINPDGTPAMNRIDIDNPTIDSTDSRDLRIEIDIGGEARMCDPAVTETMDTRRCKL